MPRPLSTWAVVLLVLLALANGCARSPEAKKARHLGRGDAYFAKEKYEAAIIEYRNVLRVDGMNPIAIRQLGLAHMQLGQLDQAFRFLLKAEELEPERLDVRLKLGELHLVGGGRDRAREEATVVLARDSKNLDALLLLARAANTPDELNAAVQRLEQARPALGTRAKFHLALGSLHFRRNDLAGAEQAFKEGVAVEPKSPDAHVALGQIYERRGDLVQAERELKTAADLTPPGSQYRIRLADLYMQMRRPDEARRVLGQMTKEAPDYLPAWRRLAEIAASEQKYDEGLKLLDQVFRRNASDIEGLMLRGRFHLAKGQTSEALQDFQQVLRLEPRLVPARYQLALAHLAAGNAQQARTELREVTKTAPNFHEAVLLLAQLNIRSGAPAPAIEDLEKLIVKAPRSLPAYRLLGTAYLAKREPAKAVEAFRKYVALAPKDPQGLYQVGVGLLAQRKVTEAKREFEAALALAPGYLEPLAELVTIAFSEKQPNVALERVKRQMAAAPKSGGLHYLLGRVHEFRGESAAAEAEYLAALDLDPGLTEVYVRLGKLYARSKRYDQAIARLDEALKLKPRNLGALAMAGLVHQARGDIPKAQAAYEKALMINPRFARAANNLAYVLAEYGGDKERALQLAQTAKQIAPDDPNISDTLGWILYKRGVYQQALGLLEESAVKLPQNPEVQYHLGMTAQKLGDPGKARRALAVAASAPEAFPGQEEARKMLAEIK